MRIHLTEALSLGVLLATGALASLAVAQSGNGVLGMWREPGGSVLNVRRCQNEICATLIYLPPNAPSHVDGKNPDPALHSRPLCGLQIGWGFHLNDPEHAADGFIYDPRSGSTYRGSLTANGDNLRLRGYIGLKIFGRTETWTHVEQAPPPCHA